MNESRRHDLWPTIIREFSRGQVDKTLTERAQWMLKEVGLVGELRPLREKKGRGLSILCLGAGKGHEMDQIDSQLPETTVTGVDPHDHWAPPVKARLERLGHNASYLHESIHGGDLREIEDGSQDAVTLFFVLHHVEGEDLEDVFSEIDRVLNKDGRIFIAEDIVESEAERQITTSIDKKINLELRNGPHGYKSIPEWEAFFKAHGFETKQVHEIKPDKVRHGFFILKRLEK
ncbi:MAG: class I SAM-dependent methyltransferase [Patescibacteria group bacterium]|jgi:SAM-dependent methyltransferase